MQLLVACTKPLDAADADEEEPLDDDEEFNWLCADEFKTEPSIE